MLPKFRFIFLTDFLGTCCLYFLRENQKFEFRLSLITPDLFTAIIGKLKHSRQDWYFRPSLHGF